jgi:CheY-like chemotaxis protein
VELAGTTIVVVDDDLDTRDLLVSVLESSGATVHAATSADEGFAACLSLRPDVLVSDIAMPGRDGHSLMRELSSMVDGAIPRVRIALTAFAGERERQQSAEAGFQRHISKPVDPAMLVATIHALLQSGVRQA